MQPRTIRFLLLSIVILASLVYCIAALCANLQIRSFEQRVLSLELESSTKHPKFILGRIETAVEDIKNYTPTYWDSDHRLLLARLLILLGQAKADLEPIEQARVILEHELARRPKQPELYIRLAEAESRLDQSLKSQAVARVKHALSLAPASINIIYQAASVMFLLEQKNDGLALLKLYLTLNPNTDSELRQIIYSLVASKHDLKAALPTTFPEALRWADYFDRERPLDFARWKSIFVSALEGAVFDLTTRCDNKRLRPVKCLTYFEQLASAPVVEEFDPLRRKLDTLRLALLDPRDAAVSLLTLRSGLDRVPVLKSVTSQDRSPAFSMLDNWMPDDATALTVFDRTGTTLGVFLPENYLADMIVLESRIASGNVEPREVEIFGSDDNVLYHSLGSMEQAELVQFLDRDVLYIRNDFSGFRYLKIRYTGTRPSGRFQHDLRRLIKVYGRSLE